MRKKSTSERTHAIVIGGGIAGLLAARVLVEHFEDVTLIERDHYPPGPTFRSGTPQARQLHSTLIRGQRILEELFPELKAKLLEQGALERDYGNQALYFYGGQQCPVVPPVLRGWNCSRMLLEFQVRQEMLKYDHFHIIEGHVVTGFLWTDHTVTGVQFHARNYSLSNPIQDLKADLVIDASGSSSHTVQWLQELGYKTVKETTTKSQISYSTQFYCSSTTYDWKGIVVQSTQQNRRLGTLMTIEKGQWMIVLAGTHEDYPPTKQTAFLDFAKTLPNQALYDAMKTATQTSPIYGYRRIENRLRHFEQLRKIEGLLIMGDALCTFNPIYGQGITVAALEAQALGSCLRRIKGQKGLASAFQKKAARIIHLPWMSATSADAKTKGLLHWYMERLITILPNDSVTFLTILEVGHMIRSPLALLHPKIILKVLTRQQRQMKK